MLWALLTLPEGRVDSRVLIVAILAVFSSRFLPIRFRRTDVYLSLADALLVVSLVLYGGQVSVLLAALVSAFALFSSGATRRVAVLLHVFTSSFAVFAAWQAVSFFFRPLNIVLQRQDLTSFIWLLAVITASVITINSAFRAAGGLVTGAGPFLHVWWKQFPGVAGTYVIAGIVGGLFLKALEMLDIYLFALVISFLALAYLTFQRFIEDLRSTVATAKKAELERAEQAEAEVQHLHDYVNALEKTSHALQASHDSFRHAAYHDSLTGLPNRNFFIDNLRDLLQKSRSSSECNFAVLFLDLRSFKTINDSLGHSLGDRLIKKVGTRMSAMAGEDDVVARFSGDKFGITLTDLLSKDEATSFADRLAKRLAEPYTLDGRQVFTSVKIGIAYGNSQYPEAEDILRDADIAMYYAKDNDENYVIFDQKMHVRAVTRLQLETDLRYAIERNEFELYYQPIVGLSNSTLIGFEALVRWRHPQRGLVAPNEFIPISESTGLIIPITLQVLHSACAQVVKWQDRSPTGRPLSVAVNLSGKHFGHPALVDQIKTVIAETGIDPGCLKLELTESAVMESAETAILMLKQIKETGVQISIDDFGTGYSSLSYLHRFPIDQLKVDRTFVSAMEENSENGEIVRTIIALAKALDLKVVAEGIESVHQFHQLRILGCEYGQGYLFSKPLPIADIERLLADRHRWQNILPAANVAPPAQGREVGHLRLA
jgi:diguanylate cyclase (GGDEF)-like protein